MVSLDYNKVNEVIFYWKLESYGVNLPEFSEEMHDSNSFLYPDGEQSQVEITVNTSKFENENDSNQINRKQNTTVCSEEAVEYKG